MIMYLNEREEFSLQSESLPYVRMFSFETYSLWGSLQGILRDVEVIPTKGPNVFSNLTAAMNGESQGQWSLESNVCFFCVIRIGSISSHAGIIYY